MSNAPARAKKAPASRASANPFVSAFSGRTCGLGGEDRVRGREGDRGQDGDAERAADLLAGVHEAGGDAGVAVSDTFEGSDRHGHERQPDPEARHDQRGHEVPNVGGVRRRVGEAPDADCCDRKSGDQR